MKRIKLSGYLTFLTFNNILCFTTVNELINYKCFFYKVGSYRYIIITLQISLIIIYSHVYILFNYVLLSYFVTNVLFVKHKYKK